MKNLFKDKRGELGTGERILTYGGTSVKLVLAVILLVVAIMFFTGGGATALNSTIKFIKVIPGFVWVILILLFLFGFRGGRRK